MIMFSCAYEINLDISQVREELKHLNNPTFKRAGYDDMCFYVSDKTIKDQGCDAVIKFKKDLGDPFVEGVRFLNMYPKSYYLPHCDSNEQGFHEDIPMDVLHPGNVNILLSEPVEDTTIWYIDPDLRKLWPWGFSPKGVLYPGDINPNITKESMGHDYSNLVEVDRFKLQDKATLFNSGVNHHIVSEDKENPRASACFVFWPYNTWQGIVEAMKLKGLLNDRVE
tara:strand:- start:14316 stop:14987 length:672 start_codon:yes stop_codon:yes gene_type:complete